MEYKPRGLAKLVGWVLEILFPRHYALLNYVHVSRYERIDPAKLIINTASPKEIAAMFAAIDSVALRAPRVAGVRAEPIGSQILRHPGESKS